MKKTFPSILFLICLFTISSFAQEEEKEIERSLKIYASFQYLPSGSSPNYYFDLPSFSYNSTALGFYREYKSKNRFVEFSLSFSKRSDEGNRMKSIIDTGTISNPPLMFIKNTYFGKSNELNIGLRFERGRWIDRISSIKVKVGFSTSLRAFAHFSAIETADSAIFPSNREQYYLTLGFVPRIRYEVNSKVYLALQFPFEFFGLGMEITTIENPGLTKSQQQQGIGSFSIGGEALIRFGVGYNF
jgi:hypothetical protein